MDFHTESGNVFLLEFTGQMALDEGGLVLTLAGGLTTIERMDCWPEPVATSGRILRITFRDLLTLPVPPSPTKTSLKVAAAVAASAMVDAALSWILGFMRVNLLVGEVERFQGVLGTNY